MVKQETLKSVITDAQTRFKLYRDVFTSKNGELLLAYMEHLYKGEANVNNVNQTYLNLGKKEVIKQIKQILNKESK